jgi:hypothetical protein
MAVLTVFSKNGRFVEEGTLVVPGAPKSARVLRFTANAKPFAPLHPSRGKYTNCQIVKTTRIGGPGLPSEYWVSFLPGGKIEDNGEILVSYEDLVDEGLIPQRVPVVIHGTAFTGELRSHNLVEGEKVFHKTKGELTLKGLNLKPGGNTWFVETIEEGWVMTSGLEVERVI